MSPQKMHAPRLASPREDEEAVQRHLALARAQGDTYGAAVAEFVALEGGETIERRAGDFHITALACRARHDGTPPTLADHEMWLAIFVRDGGDGRFVPCLRLHATLTDAPGREEGPHAQPLVWHPIAYHYGRAWPVGERGPHRLSLEIEPAPFAFSGSGSLPQFDPEVCLEIPLLSLSDGASGASHHHDQGGFRR